MYAITTSAGIILFDFGYPDDPESILVEQMKMVNLDPAQMKTILLGHGHPDHFGGAAYSQDHYGPHVYLAQADWDLIENPPPANANTEKGPSGPPAKLPEHDMVVTEGQPVVLGEMRITPVAIPGHTPDLWHTFSRRSIKARVT